MPIFDLPLAELRNYRPEVERPEDFDDFWLRTIQETRSHPLAVNTVKIRNRLALIDTYDVSFAGYGGSTVNAWLHVPSGATGRLPAVVHYLGYSRGRGLPHASTLWAQAGWAHFVMDTRGQGWSSGGDLGTADATPDAGSAHAPGFMTKGITDPETYYYRRVYADAVRMLEVARSSDLVDADRIMVTGGSQGGGITLAVAGLAPIGGIDLVGAAPDVPFLCHFKRALEIGDSDPYAEIVQYLAGWRHAADAAYRTLGYFDGVNLARGATAPALFSVGLMDTVCPPSTVFAAFNHYGGDAVVSKEINVYAHNEHEGGEDYQTAAQLDWFAARFTS